MIFLAICVFVSLFFRSIARKRPGIGNAGIICSISVDFEVFLVLADKIVQFLMVFSLVFVRRFSLEICTLKCRFMIGPKVKTAVAAGILLRCF